MTHPPTRVRTNNRHRRLTAEHRRGVVALALIAAFMVFVDGTIVNLTLAQLVTHLHASRSALQWALDAYTLSFAAVLLGAGAITDALGAKRAFVTGLLVFTVASARLRAGRLDAGAQRCPARPGRRLRSCCCPARSSWRRPPPPTSRLGTGSSAGGPPPVGSVWPPDRCSAERSSHWGNWRAVFAVNVVIGIPAAVLELAVDAGHASPQSGASMSPGSATATVLIGWIDLRAHPRPPRRAGSARRCSWPPSGSRPPCLVGFVWAERSTAMARCCGRASTPTAVFVGAAAQGALFNFGLLRAAVRAD